MMDNGPNNNRFLTMMTNYTQLFVKPGACCWCAPGFLQLCLCGRLYECVSTPEATNN